jgi:uncharacterized RDD family membrane protein YckC
MEDPFIKIETPERIRIRFRLAQTGSRAGAALIDLLIQGGFLVLVFLAYFFLALGRTLEGDGNFWEAVDALFIIFFLLLIFFLQWGYYSLFEILMNGRTPGKKALRLCVIMENGRALTASAIILRNLIRVVDIFPIISYGVGGICSLADKKCRRLGDIVAGTVVVIDESRLKGVPDFTVDVKTTVDGAPFVAELDRLGHTLNEHQLTIIRNYLQKPPTEAFSGRDEMADRLAGIVEEKTGVPKGAIRSLDYLKIIYNGHARHGNP